MTASPYSAYLWGCRMAYPVSGVYVCSYYMCWSILLEQCTGTCSAFLLPFPFTGAHLCLCLKPDSGGSAPLRKYLSVCPFLIIHRGSWTDRSDLITNRVFSGIWTSEPFSVLYNLCWRLLGNNFLTSQGLQSKTPVWWGWNKFWRTFIGLLINLL